MTARYLLVATLAIFVWVKQSPAPIIEEEKSTPSPTQSGPPKQKHSKRSTSSDEESPTEKTTKTKPASALVSQGPARFAGTWSGKVKQGILGHIASSITVNPNATSVELSHNLGGNTRPAAISGNALTWKSGVAGEITWTLTPNSDGQTAQLTMKGLLLNDTATFRRGK